jgi:undecaprenyl diphosphate synthase
MAELLDIPKDRMPRHVAIIMDGNGRWAVRQNMPRIKGHERGTKSVRAVVTECARLNKHAGGPTHLTLYSFSIENWRRPADEVAFLMSLYVQYLKQELPTMMDNNIRFKQIGRRTGLSNEVLEEVERCEQATARHTGLTLSLAINYGSRTEIVDAVQAVARLVQSGHLSIESIDESVIQQSLYTADYPDVDLLIRTAGELRISNYLLWQISYAEIVVTQTLWPDFDHATLHECFREFAKRNRRFGGLDKTNTLGSSV